MVYGIVFCFFFKQKTAYEMRISDWSSDVCSSDLNASARHAGRVRCRARHNRLRARPAPPAHRRRRRHSPGSRRASAAPRSRPAPPRPRARSLEPPSVLQSLMLISYSFFCLHQNLFLFFFFITFSPSFFLFSLSFLTSLLFLFF